MFREVIVQGEREGAMRFPNVSIANQLAMMTLNSPIFWYSPRTGESEDDLAAIVAQVVQCSLRGLGCMEAMAA
jgi:hypothetical protein